MRKQYRMTQVQLAALLAAMRPEPVMYLSGGASMHRSQQDRANDAWCALGREMGFDGMTALPAGTGDDRDFSAEEAASDGAGES